MFVNLCFLDSNILGVMMPYMRTTVTIDADTESLLREEMARTGVSFKQALNQAVRQSLGRRGGRVSVEPVFTAAFPAALSGQSFNRLADEWDDEDTLRELAS